MRVLAAAFAALGVAVLATGARADEDDAKSRLVTGGSLQGEALFIPFYNPPIFAPVEMEPLRDAGSGIPAAPSGDAAPVAVAQAAPAPSPGPVQAQEGAKPRGEPVMNGDYWLNYFWDIPRFFTAPLRFDTSDWIKTGAFVVAAGAAYFADERIHRFFHDHRSNTSDDLAAIGYRLGDSKTIVVGSAVAYAAGYGFNDYRLRETSLLVLQAWGLGQLGSEALKHIAGRQRPSMTDDHSKFDGWGGAGKSLPSGHAVNAFGVASVLSEQYDDTIWVAPVAYGLAGLVAWSRLNDNAHWASDVVVGAGLGYAIGKLVTHFSPFREQQDMSVSPMGLPGGGGIVLGFRY